jgi:hypothetical protein
LPGAPVAFRRAEYCRLRILSLHQQAHTTAEYIVGGVTGTLARPTSLLLGRLDPVGRLRYLGQTHPITAEHRRDLTDVLRGMTFCGEGSGHPWPCPLPASWSAGMPGTPELTYVPVEPVVVAEVQVDTALDGAWGKIRHRCRYVRARLDLRPADLVSIGSARNSLTPPSADPSLPADDFAASR